MRVKPGPEFRELVTSFRSSAWRWECQGTYREPNEQAPFEAWRAGSSDTSWMDGWAATIRRLTAEGKTFARVRMLTEPLTEYLRWMLSFTHVNVDAGEDIRWVTESTARGLGDMPTHDFYLLDDERVVLMEFGDHGVAGAEVTDDPDIVAQHRAWRDRVVPVAIPHRAYLAQVHMRSP